MQSAPKDAKFELRLPGDLRDRFRALAESTHRTPAQVVRMLMAEYVEQEESKLKKTRNRTPKN